MDGEKLLDRSHTVYFVDPLELSFLCWIECTEEMIYPPQKLKDLRTKIKDAEGYMAVTPEYNRSTSAAMKNTLDYFLEEYFFKPSAIVSYSPGIFGGVNAAQQVRLVFAELGDPSIPSGFTISRVMNTFSENGELVDEVYDKRVTRFLSEFEWYIEALKKQREKGTPY